MIEKWFCLKCDKCGEVCNYWQCSSIKDALREEKEQGTAIVKRDKIYCKECYVELCGEEE